MILCDTNILIEFYKNNHRIIEELRHIRLNQLAIISIDLEHDPSALAKKTAVCSAVPSASVEIR